MDAKRDNRIYVRRSHAFDIWKKDFVKKKERKAMPLA
jgi:hypothetical protein